MLETFDFDEYVGGKSVALVGPAESIIGSKLGATINSYDIVARIGEDLQFGPEELPDIGSRTDIIFDNFWVWDGPEAFPNMKKEEILRRYEKEGIRTRYMREPHPGLYDFINTVNRLGVNVKLSTKDCIKKRIEVSTETQECPTKGILAIYDLLTAGVDKLFVCGITFYHKVGYKPSYLKTDGIYQKPVGLMGNKQLIEWGESGRTDYGHNFKQELDFFITLLQRYGDVVRMDRMLTQIVGERITQRGF